jgi:hypothetical protein
MVLLAFVTVLLQGSLSVEHGHWRAVDVNVPEAGTEIRCTFSVPEGASRIQAALVTLRDAERFSQGKSMEALASTGFAHEGTLRYIPEQAGPYVLLLDNRIEGRRPTNVSVKIELLRPERREARTVPEPRRRIVVLASVLFFLGVVAYSARKLMR